jgi:hypothetical protein
VAKKQLRTKRAHQRRKNNYTNISYSEAASKQLIVVTAMKGWKYYHTSTSKAHITQSSAKITPKAK